MRKEKPTDEQIIDSLTWCKESVINGDIRYCEKCFYYGLEKCGLFLLIDLVTLYYRLKKELEEKTKECAELKTELQERTIKANE